jgi:prepilin-type N-terminal cleavage/methylation domain-containing protein
MKINSESAKAFSLIELLVVIAVIAILAALLFSVLSAVQSRARRTTCLSNLRQINSAIRMYSDDSNDTTPSTGQGTNRLVSFYYQKLMQNVGLTEPASAQNKLFACPADTFHYGQRDDVTVFSPKGFHEVSRLHSSYVFNGINQKANPDDDGIPANLGISGERLSSIKHPATTVLVSEHAAFFPYSWHHPKKPVSNPNHSAFNNSMNVVGFVDGHISYIKMYWNGQVATIAYNPPAGYDYQWSGD